MTHGLRVLLAGIVDYAGLFPPAGLDMRTAAANYADYRAGREAWALGRFVVPLGRADDLMRERALLADASGRDGEWRLSALVSGDVLPAVERVHAFNERFRAQATIDSLEVKAERVEQIAEVGRAVDSTLHAFVEVPVADDPGVLIDAIAAAGLYAKIRTGGTVPDAFPSTDEVGRFLHRCFDAGVAFKATAGLHHPLRGSYRLTYEDGAACSTMFGFLNVFLASAALRDGAAQEEVRSILDCDAAFATFDEKGVTVFGRRISSAGLDVTRERLAKAFGSCSFTEPMSELRALGLL